MHIEILESRVGYVGVCVCYLRLGELLCMVFNMLCIFQIDPDTGIITVAAPLNREEQSTYNLLIEAWDNYQFGYASRESRNAFMQLG